MKVTKLRRQQMTTDDIFGAVLLSSPYRVRHPSMLCKQQPPEA